MNALNPVRPVGDQIAEAIRIHEPRRPARRAADAREELLERVGIEPGTGARLPAHLLGRHAPARHDRPGPGLQPGR